MCSIPLSYYTHPRIVSGSDDKAVRIWDAVSGTPIGEVEFVAYRRPRCLSLTRYNNLNLGCLVDSTNKQVPARPVSYRFCLN